MGLIDRRDVARHRPKNEESRQFLSSYKYFAIKGGNRVEVCRTAFLSLHSVSIKAVIRLSNLISKEMLPIDKRGKHDSHITILQDVLVKINEHITSFPKKTSHYSTRTVTYLECGLTCKKIHELFV